MKDIIISVLAFIVAYGIMANQFGFSISRFWKRLTEKAEDVKTDYNTIKIRSISELDDFDRTRLKKEYQDLREFVNTEAELDAARQLKEIAEFNGKCPSCHDQEVTQRIETTNATSGYGKYSRLDIVKTTINHCRACGHDWEHKDNRTYTVGIYDIAEDIIRLLRWHHQAKHHTVWNPNKLDNKYESKEAAIKAEIEKLKNNHYYEQFQKYMGGRSVELAKYLVEDVLGEFSQHKYDIDRWNDYDKQPLLDWGLKQI